MAYYVISLMTVTDEAKFARYIEAARPAMREFAVRLVARGINPAAFEGNDPATRVAVMEFADQASAKAYFASPGYRAAAKLREGAATMRLIGADAVA